MKIQLVHNLYDVQGGEESVLKNERMLLSTLNDTFLYTVDNKRARGLVGKILIAFNAPFSISSFFKIMRVLKKQEPDVVHVHNYFPIISPSIFFACKLGQVPVLHTLHNYRAICPTSILMHGGVVNESCVKGGSAWTITKKVYRNSYIGSLIVSLMVELHKYLGTWHTKVDRYIALTEFARNKYIEAGWPADKIVVKPNFIEDPFKGKSNLDKKGGYALFVGRLSEEKGVDILFDAFQTFKGTLKVIGDGPLKNYVENNSKDNIQFLGRKEKDDVLELVRNADFIIMPSTWYEGFPMVLVEAFACGTPALVSRLGSMEEIVEDGVTGLHFEAGNAQDLAEKAQWLFDNPERTREMGQNARNEYLAKYTPEKNYEMLMDIYQQAIEEAKKR